MAEVTCPLPLPPEGTAVCPDCGRTYEAVPDDRDPQQSNWVETAPPT